MGFGYTPEGKQAEEITKVIDRVLIEKDYDAGQGDASGIGVVGAMGAGSNPGGG